MVNEKSTLKELEQQAKNTKLYVDRLVKANTGLTLEEILRLVLVLTAIGIYRFCK